jgi:hypothetical protein
MHFLRSKCLSTIMAVNPANPPRPALQATDKSSFAYITAKKRWPEILEKVIDDIYKTINSLGSLEVDKIQEGKRIADSLTELKYQIQQKKTLMYVCLEVYRYSFLFSSILTPIVCKKSN